jgi:uncharacterized protein (TIGR02246 family)
MRFSAFLLCAFAAAGAAEPPTADDAAIRSLVSEYMQARNHPDETALRRLFTAQADQLVSTGEWRRGRDALLNGAMASSKKENGRSSVQLESIRLIGHDAAIADGRYETTSIDASTSRKMWSTFVLERTPAGWRIAAIRNMLPVPVPAAGQK